MPTTEVVMGNHAASHGAKYSRVQVIAAYPITPQTQIVEELSEICARGDLKANFIKVESEHSAMACCIGAAQAGARAFTATSAQGLALMHELLFWAAYARLPIVMCDVNRAMAPGWSIWSDQTDSLAQRDTGWIQLYCETNQEVLDTVIMAYRLAEQVNLPVMVVYDAFILSHTYEPVEMPDQKDVDDFLPPYQPKIFLNEAEPKTISPLTSPDHYMEFRHIMEDAHNLSKEKYVEVAREFEKIFGRKYEAIEFYRADDADILLVTSGSMTSTARVAIDELRDRGEKVGLCKMRMFRPFPAELLAASFIGKKAVGNVRKVAVLDRNISHGSGGIWAQEIKSALYGIEDAPAIFDFHIGLGGRDVTPESIEEVYRYTRDHDYPEKTVWIGLKK